MLFLWLFDWDNYLVLEWLHLIDNLWYDLDGVALVCLSKHELLVLKVEAAELVLSVTFALTERSGRGVGVEVLA